MAKLVKAEREYNGGGGGSVTVSWGKDYVKYFAVDVYADDKDYSLDLDNVQSEPAELTYEALPKYVRVALDKEAACMIDDFAAEQEEAAE